jgi:hypothetical protein
MVGYAPVPTYAFAPGTRSRPSTIGSASYSFESRLIGYRTDPLSPTTLYRYRSVSTAGARSPITFITTDYGFQTHCISISKWNFMERW